MPHPFNQRAYTLRAQFPWHRTLLTKIKIEISRDEKLIFRIQEKNIIHEYGESFSQKIRTYALEEILAEKYRGILQNLERLKAKGWVRSRVREPPLFKPRYFWFEIHKMKQDLKPIKHFSLKDVRNYTNADSLIYVINNKKELVISGSPHCIEHFYLGKGEPMFAAGDLSLIRGRFSNRISYINDRSGTYWPNGDHLKKFVEEVFNNHGYTEAFGKFVNHKMTD